MHSPVSTSAKSSGCLQNLIYFFELAAAASKSFRIAHMEEKTRSMEEGKMKQYVDARWVEVKSQGHNVTKMIKSQAHDAA